MIVSPVNDDKKIEEPKSEFKQLVLIRLEEESKYDKDNSPPKILIDEVSMKISNDVPDFNEKPEKKEGYCAK